VSAWGLSDRSGTLPAVSRRNREKRAAKQKDRRRAAAAGRERTSFGGGFSVGPDRVAVQEILVAALRMAAMCPCGDLEQHAADLLRDFGPSGGREFEVAADLTVAEAIRTAWEDGWLPSDLPEFVRRRCEAPVVDYLAEAIVVESRRYPEVMLHPRWRAALAAVSAGIDREIATPHLRHWAARYGYDLRTSLRIVLEVLATLGTLPVMERLLPLPGESRHAVASTTAAGEVDEKALAKVRGLLAKAESTEFPEEAEALSAKAQELMSRYSLHQAVADHDRGRVPAASGRRLWMEAPYAGAKAMLVQSVATANRCRSVWSEKLGFVTVIGAETELDIVELLTTSLLVQANRAMLAAGSQVTRRGTSRTRSFRQSFLVSYATRIGERLDTASAAGTAEVREDSRLLPVLAARSRAAEDLTDRLFPEMVQRSVSVSNADGWGAGRAAADLALFDVHGSIAG